MSSAREASSEDRVLSGPIVSTFFFYALSSMVGLLAITTLSLVDGMFVGRYVGSHALSAITLLLPCLTVLYAVSLMLGVGGSVTTGKYLGAGDEKAASGVFSRTLLATLAGAVAFALLSLAFEAPLFRLLSVPAELGPLVSEYFDVLRWVLILQMSTMVLYYFVRADGQPALATLALVIGAGTNIALSALFVVHFGLGLRGAAYALALSQVIQAGVLSTYFLRAGRRLEFSWRQRDWRDFGGIAFLGVSEFTNEISVGLIFWLLNRLLLERLGVRGIAAFTVVNYFIFVSLMMSYGVADALHPLVSQNHGAGSQQRIRRFLVTAVSCSAALGVVSATTIVIWRHSLTGWFLTADEAELAERAAELVLVVWPIFLVNQTNVVLSCYLTAIERATPSALIAVMRGLILPACLLLAFYVSFGDRGGSSPVSDWSFLAALPLAEWLAFGLAVLLCYRHRPRVLGD
jgi:putative MATE family efflux protein